MRVAQEKVREFHDKYGYANPDTPELLSSEASAFRVQLISEELKEYEAACAQGDLTEIADALADLVYVILGTAVFHGIELQAIFDEVHRSNMTKDQDRDNLNKPIKGPTYQPPRIAELMLIQMTNLGGYGHGV